MTTAHENNDQAQPQVGIEDLMAKLTESLERIRLPEYMQYQRLLAHERYARYQAHIEAGFSKAQAAALCKE